MNINDLKYVVGKVENNQPAIVRLFGGIHEWSIDDFNREFLWLQDHVKPSKIIILINSEGGSVVAGMSAFSVISRCPIETECVIEGIAASMGSIIWAAGKKLYMHDYSLLMIHNPFLNTNEAEDENEKQITEAFRSQLETIYRQRFGMSEDQVRDIMDGKKDCDGTFFTADEAVEAGFLPKDNIIKTSKHMQNQIKNQIKDSHDIVAIRGVMDNVLAQIGENKLINNILTIHNKQNNNNKNKTSVMENENIFLNTISAQLGLAKDTRMEAVTARLSALIKGENDLKALQDSFNALEIKFNGKEAEVTNLKSELDKATVALKRYEDAEKAAFEAKIEATVQGAVEAGKIDASVKENWIKMAHVDFATAEATLNAIPAREDIVSTIANDPDNLKNINDSLKTAEDKMQEAIKAHLGEFTFAKF